MIQRMFWAFAMLYAGIASAACPATPLGQPNPDEAKPVYLLNKPWRDRVAFLEQSLAQINHSGAKLLFLGDSITQFWDSREFSKHFDDLGALNLGVSGDTTQGLLWRLPRIGLGTVLNPALVILMIGTNNTYPHGNALSAAIGVSTVVLLIRKLSPDSRILLVSILPRGPDPSDLWRQMGVEVNALLVTCADTNHVMLSDPGSKLLDGKGQLSRSLAGDFLHPTSDGYAVLSNFLYVDIHQILDVPDRFSIMR